MLLRHAADEADAAMTAPCQQRAVADTLAFDAYATIYAVSRYADAPPRYRYHATPRYAPMLMPLRAAVSPCRHAADMFISDISHADATSPSPPLPLRFAAILIRRRWRQMLSPCFSYAAADTSLLLRAHAAMAMRRQYAAPAPR